MRLQHQLRQNCDEEDKVDIIEVAALPIKPDTWQAKFVANRALGNNKKYWQRIQRALASHLGDFSEIA